MYERMVRNYEVSIWTLQDRFLSVLKPYDVEIKGQLQEPKFSIKDDGTEEFSFSIPMYYMNAEGRRIQNPLWVNKINGNLVAALRKIKLIFKKGSNKPVIYEMLITKVSEKHSGFQLTCEVNCEGLAFHELGKIGYRIALQKDAYYNEYNEAFEAVPDELTQERPPLPINNIQYWNDKIFTLDGKNKWQWTYEVRMSHAMNQGKGLAADKVYEDDYVSSWTVQDNKLVSTNYEVGKEKCRLIDEKDSNVYNLTQNIAKTFGVFCRYEYEHNPVTFEITGKKVIYYDEYLMEGEGTFDINYPYDTSEVTRTSDANDVATKLFVLEPGGGGNDSGEALTIMNTEANKLGEDYILNFDYLKTIGCITPDQEEELKQFEVDIKKLNNEISTLQAEQRNIEYLLNNTTNGLLARQTILENSIKGDKEQLSAADDLLNQITNNTGVIDLAQLEISKPVTAIPSQDMEKIEQEDGPNLYKYTYYVELTEKGILAGSIKLYEKKNFSTNKVNPDTKISLENAKIITDEFGYLTRIENIVLTKTLTEESDETINSSAFFYAVYTYAPQLYYEAVKKMWQQKLNKDEDEKEKADEQVENLNNTLNNNVLPNLSTALEKKRARIAEFERIMGAAIREGYWQPEDDYKDYGDKNAVTKDLKKINGKLSKYAQPTVIWQPPQDEFGEQKAYYEIGVSQERQYYYYIRISQELMSWINTTGKDQFSFIFYDSRDTDPAHHTLAFRKVYTIGSRMQYAIVKEGDKYIPVLLLTGTQEDSIDDATFDAITTSGQINWENCTNTSVVNAKQGTTIGVAVKNNQQVENEWPAMTITYTDVQGNTQEIITDKGLEYYYFNITAGVSKQTITATNGEVSCVYTTPEAEHIQHSDPKIGIIKFNDNDELSFIDSNQVFSFGQCSADNDLYYPHIQIANMYLKTSSDELLLRYADRMLAEFVDYSVLSQHVTTQNEVYDAYFISPYIRSFITNWYNNDIPVELSYSISNATTSIYLDALEIAKQNAYPKVEYEVSLNVINKQLIEEAYNLLGHIASINDYELQFRNVLGYVSELELSLDKPWEDSVKIKNYKNKFEDLFSTIVAQTQQMQKNSATIGLAAAAFTADGNINEDTIANTMRHANLDYQFNQGTLTIDNANGIWATSDSGVVAMRGGGIFTATRKDENDNWIWNTGITPAGINADLITTGQLDTNRIRVYAGDTLRFQLNADGLFAYKTNSQTISNQLNRTEDDQETPVIKNRESLSTQLNDTINNAGYDSKQYVVHNSEGLFLRALSGAIVGINEQEVANENGEGTHIEGSLVTTNQDVDRVEISWDGFKLRNYAGQEVFYADPDTGDLNITGAITATSGAIGGWTIDTNSLHSGANTSYVGLNSDSTNAYALWAGDESPEKTENGVTTYAHFSVTKSGQLRATDAIIEGAITATSFQLAQGVKIPYSNISDAPTIPDNFTIDGISSNYQWNGNTYKVAITSTDNLLIGANTNYDTGIIIAKNGNEAAVTINQTCINFDYSNDNYIHMNSNGISLNTRDTNDNDVSIIMGQNGLQVNSAAIQINGEDVWSRGDIIIMNPNADGADAWRSSVEGIEGEMNGQHDWVLIRPFYDSSITYNCSNLSGTGTSNSYSISLTGHLTQAGGNTTSFGDGASFYQYQMALTFKGPTREQNSGGSVSIDNFTIYLSNTAMNSNNYSSAPVRLQFSNSAYTANPINSVGYSGAVGDGTGSICTVKLQEPETYNLCKEDTDIYYYISASVSINGGTVTSRNFSISNIRLICTNDTTTSRVPCTVYYYP